MLALMVVPWTVLVLDPPFSLLPSPVVLAPVHVSQPYERRVRNKQAAQGPCRKRKTTLLNDFMSTRGPLSACFPAAGGTPAATGGATEEGVAAPISKIFSAIFEGGIFSTSGGLLLSARVVGAKPIIVSFGLESALVAVFLFFTMV